MSISAENTTHESVAAGHTAPEPTPEEAAQLEELYRDFDRENLIPLWTEIADLMPMVPSPKAVPHVWRWSDLYPLAARAGDLVPVGRGGERRAIALANPGLAGTPPTPPPRCGQPSSTSAPARPPRNTATRRTLSASSSRARVSGRW